MKWITKEHHDELSLGKGLILVSVTQDLCKSGYRLYINRFLFNTIFKTSEEAKQVAEQYLRKTIKEMYKLIKEE